MHLRFDLDGTLTVFTASATRRWACSRTTSIPAAGRRCLQLSAAGHRLWVATGKPHVYARALLSHFRLADAFAGVHGSELSGANSDKAELIAHVLRTEGIAPDEAWMIGDRRHDVRGAHRNGVAAVGVLWGYGSEEELRAAGPAHLVASMDELCALFDRGTV